MGEYPVIAGPGGVATVTICPFSMFFAGAAGIAGDTFRCFLAISQSGYAYTGVAENGPFRSMASQVSAYYPDQCKVSFVSTQSALNAKGRILMANYDESPNASFDLDST